MDPAFPSVYTVVDNYLGLVPGEAKLKIGRQNLIAGVSTLLGNSNFSFHPEFLELYSQRQEAISYGNHRRKPESVFKDLSEQLYSYPDINLTNPREAGNLLYHLNQMAIGHENLKQELQPVSLSTPENTTINIQYSDSQWEGIGSINFFLTHPSSDDAQIPTFVIRGNPADTMGKSFNIRSVQAWLSEDMASVAGIKAGYFGLKTKYSPEKIEWLDNVLCERNRILDILIRNNARGTNVNGEYVDYEPEDLFLNLGLTYLQMNGISTIRGINHELHPVLLRSHKSYGCFNLNYNQLFARHLKGTGSDPTHPWELKGDPNHVYLPNVMDLPPSLKLLLTQMLSNR